MRKNFDFFVIKKVMRLDGELNSADDPPFASEPKKRKKQSVAPDYRLDGQWSVGRERHLWQIFSLTGSRLDMGIDLTWLGAQRSCGARLCRAFTGVRNHILHPR